MNSKNTQNIATDIMVREALAEMNGTLNEHSVSDIRWNVKVWTNIECPIYGPFKPALFSTSTFSHDYQSDSSDSTPAGRAYFLGA